MSIWYYILRPFSALLMWLYETCGSYALSLVLFTLIIRIILFPLSLKGKKSMMQMSSLSARAQQLQKQYGKDKERYNAELTKLYEKAGVNPMGGCLWTLIPMPILIGLYSIIRRPMHYMMGITDDGILAVAKAMGWVDYTHGGYNEIALTNMLNNTDNFQAAQGALGELSDRLTTIDFSFLGLDLSQTPNWRIWEGPFDWATLGLVLIPVLVAILAFLSSKVSMKTNSITRAGGDNNSNAAVDKTNRQMMYMMPIMYVWFGFIMPAGMSVYMSATSVIMMIQDFICSKMLRRQFEELEQKRIAQELEEKEEEKRLRAERAAERARQAEEAKKNRGKKKPASSGDKKKHPSNEASRVGIRAYARGRAYDPDRYGGVTPYHDPNEAIDEEAVEQAREAKGMKAEEAVAGEEVLEEDAIPAPETQNPEVTPDEEASAQEAEEAEEIEEFEEPEEAGAEKEDASPREDDENK